MKTRVIRYNDSSNKGLASGTHPNTPSVEFYPTAGTITEKNAWTKHKDDASKDDYWYNSVTEEVNCLEACCDREGGGVPIWCLPCTW